MSAADSLALDLASRLPPASIVVLANAAAEGPTGLAELRRRAGSATLRAACDQVAALYGSEHSPSPERLAGLLLGASAATAAAAEAQRIDVVWTGPASEVSTSRMTAATVADLIDGATRELLVVSFATFVGSSLSDALYRAAARDVDITLLLERPEDNPGYTGPTEPLPSLRCRRWAWPAAARAPGAALHAKVIVVDGHTALLGSANLTGRAITDNLECGMLIRGGAQPKAIRKHLWSLRYRELLQDISPRSN